MPLPDLVIPASFNTLDDQPFADGHPASSWSGRELIHNDRWCQAHLRRSLLCTAWEHYGSPFTFRSHIWSRVVTWIGETSPGQETVSVHLRCVASNGLVYNWAVETLRTGPFQRRERASWLIAGGTGAVQNLTISGVPVLPGVTEHVDVFLLPGLRASAVGDVTGTVAGHPTENLLSSTAADMGGLGPGWAIRIEDGATGQRLTRWHSIIDVVAGNTAVRVTPQWSEWPDLATAYDDSGASVWRARPVCNVEVHSITIEEDELTGSLGD